MRSFVVILLALIVGCACAKADSLSDIRTLRSLSAEVAQVIRLHAQHRVSDTYAVQMKREAREELQSSAQSAGTLQLKQMAQQAISDLDRNDSNALARLAQRLLALEAPHGRAD